MTAREELRERGDVMRARLFGADGGAQGLDDRVVRPDELAPGFADLASEIAHGAVWSRPGLALPDRMICTLAALGAVQRLTALRRHVAAALEIGIAPRSIQEVLIQIGIYAGFTASEEALEVARSVFLARDVALPTHPPPRASLDELAARGRELLESLHGGRGYQGYAAPDNPVTSALYPLAIQYGYGEIWFRPGLDRRERALCAVAAFTALRMEAQVKRFGRSALNVGLNRTEVTEAIVQTAPYSGFAPALNALAALAEALG